MRNHVFENVVTPVKKKNTKKHKNNFNKEITSCGK